MPKKQKKKASVKTPAPIRWEFDPDIPTHDFLEEECLDDTVQFFVDWLEDGRFLTWEAVVCEELGPPFKFGLPRWVNCPAWLHQQAGCDLVQNDVPEFAGPWDFVDIEDFVILLIIGEIQQAPQRFPLLGRQWQSTTSLINFVNARKVWPTLD